MPVEKQSAIRLAAAIAGVENHDDRMRRDPDYAYALKKSASMLREYHAILGLANRLELLVRDAEPPVTFDTSDLADGALRPPFIMLAGEERTLLKAMRGFLARSAIAKIEVTAEREIVLYGNVYDVEARKSTLEPVCWSAEILMWRTG